MTATFNTRYSIRVAEFGIEFEEEEVEVPTGYDMGGRPPIIRIMLRLPNESVICHSLNDLILTSTQRSFPIADFCRSYPLELAIMISEVEELGRPIKNNELFEFLETEYGVNLKNLEPKFENGILTWHVYDHKLVPPISRRSLTFAPVKLF